MSGQLEIELKLEMDPADRERLESNTLFAAGGVTDRLVSTYFDTPDLDLHAAGYSLRVRRKGRRRIQTVKADGDAGAGYFARAEWEKAIRGDTPVLDAASGPLVGALGAALEGLAPVFVSDVRRTVHAIRTAGATIECGVDQGEIRAGDRHDPICEVELELGAGAPQALFDVARCLNEDVPLRLGVQSKAGRGYDLVAGVADKAAKAEPIDLDPVGDAGDAFEAIARSCLRQFRLNEAQLLKTGEVESLHQARVGLRRLRSAMSLFKPLLEADPHTRSIGAELRWLAGELGEVRNLDVLIARVDDRAREQLVPVRAQAIAQVRTVLESARARRLMIDLAEWLALGDWRARPADPALLHRNVVAAANDLLDDRRKRVARRGRGLVTLDDPHRHKLRIEAKKLRYASDFFASLHRGKKVRRRHKIFLDALEALQDRLGELNDLATGRLLLARLGIAAQLPKADGHRRKRLLDRAEKAYDALIGAQRFWR